MRRDHPQALRTARRALVLSGALALAFTGTGTALADTPNPIAQNEWALNYFNATQIRKQYNAHGNGVIVAVIDTGVDPQQPDLQGRLVQGVNLVDPNNPTSDYNDTDTQESHGTSVATVIAGQPHKDSSGNYYGMIGLADGADIMPVKVSNNGHPTEASIAAGVLYAVDHGAQVINISIASYVADQGLTEAISTALSHGVVVVVGTGNDAKSGNAANTIATVPGVLDVAGIDSNGQKFSFGHYGPDVDVAAPANDIEVGLIGGKYNHNDTSGTSQAAPWVSGEAALLIAEHPTWTSGQIVATIIDNTQETANGQVQPGSKVDQNFGYGIIDPLAALGAAEPSSTANPLGGPPITSTPAQNVKSANSGSAAATPGATNTTGSQPSASSKSSSKTPIIIGVAAAVVILLALLIFLLTRRNRGGRGGSGGGGAGGNYGSYTPQVPPGGHQAQPPQQYQPNPYQQQPPPQGYFPPQGGPHGQQQNPYTGA